jgi:capsular polysaccharide biosynthesis protein
MDLGEILRVMRKRWYLMAPIMALTAVLTGLAYLLLPTTYESTSTVSLLTAERASIVNKSGNTNPYLTFDSSLVATADFLSRSLSSKGSQDELKGMGVTEEYTVALADNAQGPFISIVVDGTNASKVLRSTSTLTDYASRRLTDIQTASGVRPEDMIRLTTIIPPQKPQALIKAKLQSVIAVAAIGTALAFLITFVTEGMARSRRATNRAASPVAASVRSTAPSRGPMPEQPATTYDKSDKPVIVGWPPEQRVPAQHSPAQPPPVQHSPVQHPLQRTTAAPPVSTPGDATQIVINGALSKKAVPVIKGPPPKQTAPVARPHMSATVYRSNATNGKSHDDGDRSREAGD